MSELSELSDSPFQKPGVNKRVCGYIIDLLVVITADWVLYTFLGTRLPWFLFPLYWLLRDSVNGQSIGKMVVGLQVVTDGGNTITPAEGIMRNIPLAIPFVVIIEYIIMRKDDDGKRLGDKLAKTKVNDLKPQVSEQAFLGLSIVIFILIAFINGMMPREFENPMDVEPEETMSEGLDVSENWN